MKNGSKMDLLDEGCGLLKTHVTKDFIESILQKVFQTDSSFGDDWTAKSIADGVGFISIIGLVEPKWTGNGENLPKKLIVKMPTCINMTKMAESMDKEDVSEEEIDEMLRKWQTSIRQMHNLEASFYDYLSKKSENYEELKLPKIYYTKHFDDEDDLIGFILMEYLEDFKISHLYNNISAQRAEQALKAWAHLQAFTFNDEFLENDLFKTNCYRTMYEKMMNSKNLKKMVLTIGKVYPELEDLSIEVEKLAEEIYNMDNYEADSEKRGMKMVLAHGDLWSTNVLWRKSDDSLRSLIDFQMIHRGSPGEDIARFLITSLSGEERRKNEDHLLERYHQYFKEFLNGREMPFTLDQLKANYRSVFPFNALMNSAMFGPICQYLATKIEDEKAKESMKRVCVEKARAMFEDLIKYHSESS